MKQARSGQTVKVHYIGRLDDGTIFDSSVGREPLEFTVGENRLLNRFENAVVGMACGDSKTVRIPSDKAYGPHRKDLVMYVDKEEFSEDYKLELNQCLQISHPDGEESVATITNISESIVTLDANHPLAGKDLTFDFHLVEIC